MNSKQCEIVKAWSNGERHASGAGYGIRISPGGKTLKKRVLFAFIFVFLSALTCTCSAREVNNLPARDEVNRLTKEAIQFYQTADYAKAEHRSAGDRHFSDSFRTLHSAIGWSSCGRKRGSRPLYETQVRSRWL